MLPDMGGQANSAVLFFAISAALLLHGSSAAEYIVGDSFGWAIPRGNDLDFYERWTANKTFHAGDTFVFNWNGTHTVTERSKEEYDSCDKEGGIDVVTSGLRRTLEKNGTYYYICKVDNHCQQGQKIRLVIGDGVNDDDNGRDNSSAAVFGPAGEILAAAVAAVVMFLY